MRSGGSNPSVKQKSVKQKNGGVGVFAQRLQPYGSSYASVQKRMSSNSLTPLIAHTVKNDGNKLYLDQIYLYPPVYFQPNKYVRSSVAQLQVQSFVAWEAAVLPQGEERFATGVPNDFDFETAIRSGCPFCR
jgi:hypothetical protein